MDEHLPNRTVVHADYVMTLDGRSFRMAAACWLGGERGDGCSAFPDSAPCDLNVTSYCLLFKGAVAVGDVVVKFDWQRPVGAACNLLEDASSGWRKDYRAFKFWGGKASLFADARIAVLSDLSVYNTEVTLAEQCGDLMQHLWENMVIDYELPSYNHTFKKNVVNQEMGWFREHKGLGEEMQRAILNQPDRLARVDINHYGYGSISEVQIFAAWLPKRMGGESVEMIKTFLGTVPGTGSSWLKVAELAHACYRNTGVKLVSVARDTHADTRSAMGRLLFDATTHGKTDTSLQPRNWPRAYVQLHLSTSADRLDPRLCTAMDRPTYTEESCCYMERPKRSGRAAEPVSYVEEPGFGWRRMVLLLLGCAVVAGGFVAAEAGWIRTRRRLEVRPVTKGVCRKGRGRLEARRASLNLSRSAT